MFHLFSRLKFTAENTQNNSGCIDLYVLLIILCLFFPSSSLERPARLNYRLSTYIILGILSGPAAQMGRSSLQPGGGPVSGVGPPGVAGLTVALPPPRSPASPASPSLSQSSITAPPRPPPPRQSASPSSRRAVSPVGGVPPSLPPKQYQHRPVPAQPPLPGAMLVPTKVAHQPHPPAAAPTPAARSIRGPVPAGGAEEIQPTPPPPPRPQPAVPSATAGTSPTRTLLAQEAPRPTHCPGAEVDQSEEAADNASNECSVCLDKPVDCVIYTCGHMCVCYECAVDIKDNQGALCPICRRQIVDIIKIYRS